MRWRERIAFVFAATGLLSQGAWAAGLPSWPLPQGFRATPLADELDLVAGAADTRLFEKEMRRSCEGERGRFMEGRLGRKFLWSCMREPYSQTLQWEEKNGLLEGEMSTSRIDEKPRPSPLPIQLPEGSNVVSDVESRDGRLRGRVLLVDSNQSPLQLRSALLRIAQASGWKPIELLSRQTQRLSLRKKGESLDVAFPGGKTGVGRFVLVWQNR